MRDQASRQGGTVANQAHRGRSLQRVQRVRRARRREELPDRTVTDSWPPRLNTAL